jgi:hypothetical protein
MNLNYICRFKPMNLSAFPIVFGVILTYIGCVLMVYSENVCQLWRHGR